MSPSAPSLGIHLPRGVVRSRSFAWVLGTLTLLLLLVSAPRTRAQADDGAHGVSRYRGGGDCASRHHSIVDSFVAEPELAAAFAFLEEQLAALKERVEMPSGAAITVVRGDAVVYEGYFGCADVESAVPVDSSTHFYIASTAKAFLSLATLLAEHEGDLEEATTLTQLFPTTTFADVAPDSITVRHLLTHTSGLDQQAFTWAASYTGQHDPALRRRFVATLHPDEDTQRGQYQYTNLGYNVMSVWFEEHYGRDWRETLEALVLAPLHMDETTGFISEVEAKGWAYARPYSYKFEGGRRQVYLP